MTANAPLRTGLAVESVVFAGRLLTRWRRHPVVPIQSLLLPTLLLITYSLMVSKSMTKLTGANGLHGLVPMCAVGGAMLGALGAAFAIPKHRDSGILSRFWLLPVHRASALTGTLLAEAIRTLGATVLIMAVGFALGFRFHGGWLAMLVFILMPVLVVVVFATVAISIAVRSRSSTMLTWVGTASTSLVFCNAGVAPLQLFPSWLRPLVQFQPMSPVIDSMQALAEGHTALWPMTLTFGWILGLSIIFVPFAVRGYRTAAES